MKKACFILVLFFFVDYSKGFAECPSKEPDPDIPGVDSCMSWATRLDYTDAFISNCDGNAEFKKKCCWTCEAVSKMQIYLKEIDAFSTCKLSDCVADSLTSKKSCSFCQGTRISFKQKYEIEGTFGKNCNLNGSYYVIEYYGLTFARCSCKTNQSVGYTCQRINPCTSNNQCLNGAECIPSNEEDSATNMDYICKCKNNWYGKNCDIQLSECSFGYSGIKCDKPVILALVILLSIVTFLLLVFILVTLAVLIISRKKRLTKSPTTEQQQTGSIQATDEFYNLYSHIKSNIRNSEIISKQQIEEDINHYG